MTPEEYIKQRVDDQIDWYNKKSGINKQYNNLTKGLVIVLSALITLLSGFSNLMPDIFPWLIGLMGSSIAILSGLNALMKFQEKWNNYRSTAEVLIQEKFRFLTSTDPYTDKTNSFNTLVKRVESTINQEVSEWSRYMHTSEQSEAEEI